ncbi:GNAT family N-acetyltransferase [Streptomyces benahoarensis]|uniref:GNAT family N-acetyltransferase n=1 Tax=Streptomyces benahoarensis TaxID=2595054 RepID=A0A553XY41_9ACTN|nr:GNAT family N-acetyltransferase [Streptomyces benahoarensis]TSB21188.1 GNAT family N-acetyltransferase [Streptomyces benahoarensis]TSB21890.1 GNAT family N-acetyltransferase [Streptomyces benahoarensis]
MSPLHIVPPADDAALQDWRHVHNTVIPTHGLSLEDVRERAVRHRLEVAYLDGALVGCSTVRPPVDGTATVIARVLAAHRGRGYGAELYTRGLDRARQWGAEAIETVVLASNEDGLRFALRHGFAETERYLLPGDTIPWIDLRLT